MTVDVIREALAGPFAAPGSIASKIQNALLSVTSRRDEPGRSTDTALRDAEYYLHGLYGAAANDWEHILVTIGSPVYDAIKWAAFRCRDVGLPQLLARLRTDPSNPVSEPGGAIWAYRGLLDGLSIDGSLWMPVGHPLVLPTLDAILPSSTCGRQ